MFILNVDFFFIFSIFLKKKRRRLSHGDDTPKAVYREFWRFDARRTAKEAKIGRRGTRTKRSNSKQNKGSSGSDSKSTSHLSSAYVLQQKRMNAVSKNVTTKPGQGHPNVDSQAFNNWLRLHFGGAVPEARPMQTKS